MNSSENVVSAKKTVVHVCKKWLLVQCLLVNFCTSTISDLLCGLIRDKCGVRAYICARERELLKKKLTHLRVGYKKSIKGGGRQRQKFIDSQCLLLLPCTVTVNSVSDVRLHGGIVIPDACPVRARDVHSDVSAGCEESAQGTDERPVYTGDVSAGGEEFFRGIFSHEVCRGR